MPVGQSGATEPGWWTDKMVKVTTPAMEVTKVEARVAGATSAAGVCLPGRPSGGEPQPKRKQDGGYDQIEDLRAGD